MDLTEVSDKDVEETLSLASKAYFEHLKRDSVPCDVDGEPSAKKKKVGSVLEQLMSEAPVQIEKLGVIDLCSEDAEPVPTCSRAITDTEADDNSVTDQHKNNLSPASSDIEKQQSNLSPTRSPTLVEDVLNAVGHPTVLKQVALQFLNNVKQRNSSN